MALSKLSIHSTGKTIVLWCASAIAVWLAVGNAQSSDGRNIPQKEREWHSFYIYIYNVPVYEEPSLNSKIVARLGKGDTVSNYIKRGDPRPWERKGWFYFPEILSRSVFNEWERIQGGWVETQNLLPSKEFTRVTEWPFRYLVVDSGFYSRSYCFKTNGEGWYISRREDKGDVARRHAQPNSFLLFSTKDILTVKEQKHDIGRAFALYDRKNQRLCPIGHTEKECDRVVEGASGEWMFALISDHSKLAKERYSKYCLGKPYVPE